MTKFDDRTDAVGLDVVAPLRAMRPQLDEIHRARLYAALEGRLDDAASAVSRPRTGWRPKARSTIAAGTLLLGVAAAVTLAFLHGTEKGREAVLRAATASDAQRRPPLSPAAGRPPVLFSPYLYSGPGADGQSMNPAPHLSVPARARARAAIGTRLRLTLIGPAELSVAAGAGERDIDLTLGRGRLLVDYDGQAGGTLRVRSPGAVTTVVGTLFSVDAAGGETRVAVSRGRIHTETRTDARDLPTGTAWLATGGDVTPIPRDVAQAFAEHELSVPPPIGEYGLVLVAASGPAGGRSPSSTSGASSSPTPVPIVTVDGGPLAAAPLVARISAGSHLVNEGGRLHPIDVAGGTIVRLEATSPPVTAQQAGARSEASAPGSEDLPVLRSSPAPALRGSGTSGPGPAHAIEETAPLDLEATYQGAEAAMRAGARDEARRLLRAIVAADPSDARAEAALLDLARLALADGDVSEARRQLARLPEPTHDAALAESAHHLRCQIDLLLHRRAEADACLVAFRRRYPASFHDAEALAMLSAHAVTCEDARPLLSEYVRRYPDGPFAAAARARLVTCGAGD